MAPWSMTVLVVLYVLCELTVWKKKKKKKKKEIFAQIQRSTDGQS